jgi:uncharacterized protein (DUF433 family)/DNA-binding transcriptional MerR regulator
VNTPSFRLIGRGLYSLREAHRLTGVPTRRIRRWTSGYRYGYEGRFRFSPPIVATDVPKDVGSPAIDFADLLEVRFLNVFREHGVSWKAIRIASQRARDFLGVRHPFSSRRFSTDGQTILAEFVTETGDEVLIDLVRNQYELRRIISQYLFGEIDFNEDEPTRWWPVPNSRRIVIDPQRAFGAPIVDIEGVPTRILARAVVTEDSIELVASLYEVDPISVAEALEYELSRPA